MKYSLEIVTNSLAVLKYFEFKIAVVIHSYLALDPPPQYCWT